MFIAPKINYDKERRSVSIAEQESENFLLEDDDDMLRKSRGSLEFKPQRRQMLGFLKPKL
jgi:hypothetical protein